MNVFRPMCECVSGFKSSNLLAGKILSSILDVCIPCRSSAGCGRAPTISPTYSPSKSSRPTVLPSISPVPTLQPTSSNAPSFRPTSAVPTVKPTISSAPSSLPTTSPTRFFSVYDGDYCKSSLECRSTLCVTENCRQLQVC